MTAVDVEAAPVARSDRLLAAVPVTFSFLVVASLYVWQASKHPTPWLFSDEIEYAQISRAIAETGKPARRGVEYWGAGLFPWLIAPFWWIDNLQTAYSAVKTFNSLVMTAAMFPTYLLARMLMARPYALLAAVGAVAGTVLHLLGHGDAGADRLLRRRAGLLRRRPTARRGDTLEHRRSGRRSGRGSVRPGPADHRAGDHDRGPRAPLRVARPGAGRRRSRLLAPAGRLRRGALVALVVLVAVARAGATQVEVAMRIAGDDARPDALGVGRADRSASVCFPS